MDLARVPLTNASPSGWQLQALDEYCVASARDTESRQWGKPGGAPEGVTGNRVKGGPVASAAQSIAGQRNDASGVGAGGVQGC
jgi:hypothetical protein